MKKRLCITLFFLFNLSCSDEQRYEIPIPTSYFIHPDIGSIKELHNDYSCHLRPFEKKTAIIRCFPTVEFFRERLFFANYISCDIFPPGEILLGIIDNPKPGAQSPYCFIWAFPPKTSATPEQPHKKTIETPQNTANPVKKL